MKALAIFCLTMIILSAIMLVVVYPIFANKYGEESYQAMVAEHSTLIMLGATITACFAFCWYVALI